jgi:hypothetical protein
MQGKLECRAWELSLPDQQTGAKNLKVREKRKTAQNSGYCLFVLT